jgi:uncharacterized membrane protein YkoI
MNPARLGPLLVAFLLTVSPGLIRGADSEGTVVKLSDLPAAAQATIKEHQGRGRLGEIVKTIESGEAHYDVEVTKQGRTRSLVLNDKGEVIELQVFLGETPRPIQQAIRKQVDGGRIEEITKNTEDGEVSYDVEMTKNGKARTFTLDESGELKEMQVFLDELPDPVRKALQKEVGTGKCGEINKADEDGNFLFETEITQGTKTRSVSFDSLGTLVYQEEPTTLPDVPEPVRKSAQEQLGDGKLVSIDKVTDDGQVSYVVDFLKEGKQLSLSLSTDGKVLINSN